MKKVILFLFLMATLDSYGQCTNCIGNSPQLAIPVTLDEFCEITIVGSALLDNELTCPGDKELILIGPAGNVVISAFDVILLNFSEYVGDTMRVILKDISSGDSCVTYLHILDNGPPVIECDSRVISCIADTSATSLGFPMVLDECALPITYSYRDSISDLNCSSPVAGVISRIWTVTDGVGNASECIQVINLNRLSLTSSDILFPGNRTLGCNDDPNDLNITGVPRFNGFRIFSSSVCDIDVSMSDQTTLLTNPIGTQITRTWVVTNLCDGTNASQQQTITIRDMDPPSIICPGDTSIGTNTGFCEASFLLSIPLVTDACDANPTFQISSTVGQGRGPHLFPKGVTSVIYTGFDRTGNQTSCTQRITVFDAESPVANCNNTVNISLSGARLTPVDAIRFDSGSRDNCGPLFYKVRRNDVGKCGNSSVLFGDQVNFCCADVGEDSLMVTLRVYDVNPGMGGIGADQFSGHFSDCMVRVVVSKNLPPELVCPANATIDCRDDYNDLSRFGFLDTSDLCIVRVDYQETILVDNCGTGQIRRQFTVTDVGGNSSSCTQIISVVNQTPFDANNIIWPSDIRLFQCGAAVKPVDLPDTSSSPRLINEACSMVMYHASDEIFQQAFPACYVVKRTWSVMDWCAPNPEEHIFRHVQTIEVIDSVAPVIVCPKDTIVSLLNSCEGVFVNLAELIVDDCSPNLKVIHDSPFAQVQGSNASGFYPVGETKIFYEVSDLCGNKSCCETTVRVEDLKPPSPICMVGLTVNLALMNGIITSKVEAERISVRSFDNCTSPTDLKLRVRRDESAATTPPLDSILTFGCNDLGQQMVQLWAIDTNGNFDFCRTVITVQDNKDLCSSSLIAAGKIMGNVTTEKGLPVKGVKISGKSTNETGYYELSDLTFGKDYLISPSKEDDVLKGVSTLDLMMISKHILGVTPLSSPYKMIAADVDRSGAISTMDLIFLRRIILGIDKSLPGGRSPWCFIDASFKFPENADPLKLNFPESVHVFQLNQPIRYVDFIAVKIGDVNDSAQPLIHLEPEQRSGAQVIEIPVAYDRVFPGQELEIDVTDLIFQDMSSIQLALQWNTESLSLIGFYPGNLDQMSGHNFGLTEMDKGIIRMSWNELSNSGTTLFKLAFRVIKHSRLTNELFFGETVLRTELIDWRDNAYQLRFRFKEGDVILDNFPNPFMGGTSLRFSLPASGDVEIEFFDAYGRRFNRLDVSGNFGINEVPVDRFIFGDHHGLIYYKIKLGEYSAVGKMLRR
jgi:hypothetical protein